MKKKLILCAIALFVVLTSLIVGLVVIKNPTNVALRSIKNFSSDILSREEIQPICQTLTGGSIEASIYSMERTHDDEKVELLEDSYLSGKIYFSKEGVMLKNFDSMFNGKEISGEAYLSTSEVYIQENNILKDAYGFKISTLADELENSIFAPGSNSSYEMDEEAYDYIIKALSNLSENGKFEKDISNLLETIIEDTLKIITENATIESEKTTTRIGSEKIKVRVITITIDDNAMKNILTDIYDYVYSSDEITDFIEKYNDTIISILGTEYDESEYNSLIEAYEEWLEDFESEIDDMCDDIDDHFETLKISIATPRAKARLLKLEVEYDNEKVFLLDIGRKGIKKTDAITIDFPDEDVKITYKVNDDKKIYESTICIDAYYDYEISFTLDKERENYTLKIEEDYKEAYAKYIIKGELSTEGKKINLSIDKMTRKWKSNYSTFESTSELKLDCNIIIDPKDKMPEKIKDYNGISSITERQLDRWIEKIEDIDF